jgi:hypothetical protein
VDTILTILAIAGVAAAVWHLLRAAFRFLSHGATGLWVGELGRTRARRGDVTGLQDAERDRREARSRKNRAGLEATGWLVLLVAPSLTPWARHIYAVCAVLWIVPALRGRGV